MPDTGAGTPLTARLSEALRRTHPRLLAETLATLAARPATDPAGLDAIVDELMDMVDWTGTGDRLSGRRERRKYEARITAARSRYDNLRAALDSTRGALVTVAQWDSWASEWLANHPRGDDDDA